MSTVRRIYVEKKAPFAGKARELRHEISGYLGIKSVKEVRQFIRYDVENVSDEVFEKACRTVFSEPPVDVLYRENIEIPEGAKVFSIEALPGQFDQRADSAEQCVRFIKGDEEPVIRTAVTYMLIGDVSDEELKKIQEYTMNPVDSRIASDSKPETLVEHYDEPEDVKVFDGFKDMDEKSLKDLYESLGLAMTFNDFKWIQQYFAGEEHRDPTMTEIRVLDTYWSDHCRHTTFGTELKNIEFEDGFYKTPIEKSYEDYLAARDDLYKTEEKKQEKFISLMDIALMGMKKLKADGKLTDMEVSEENNACTVVVPVEVDYGKGPETENWLVFFKNETHNHPTEIEPFGGAATCLGGAIRDPLSGRGYVYQAMRVTGAADPTVPVSETMKGKLSQKKLVRGAAAGYSSYGNQIGLATGYVKEVYHPGYVAKRMEIGAVMGAAPQEHVIRESADPGDIIILLGGRTGRDGCGGATGSSKAHDSKSLTSCGAEVQKGNAPTERKLQRLFRRPEVSELIKKCNDFGAGGVSVAIGELAPGLDINLDLVPKKYAGLDGTELAISESQERMAVVVAPKDAEQFLAYAAEENLEAVKVAVVTEEPRLVLNWRGKKIVDIKRAFLDTNGAHQETQVKVEIPDRKDNYFDKIASESAAKALADGDAKAAWLGELEDLNVCSQKGLVEMFDSSIGAGTVVMPYGGKYQLTETQTMIAKLPVLSGKTDTVTMMSYGFDPYLSSWSPYHGAAFAVTESVARIVAAGGDYRKLHFTFQEYFKRMTEDPTRWSQPFTALLGAFDAQMKFGIASIGGKDSMSGSFNEINVPPTLVSFAVDVASLKDVVTPELKKAGNKLVQFKIAKDEFDLPDYEKIMKLYGEIHELMAKGVIVSAYAEDAYGIAAAVSKMAFGNGLGVKIADSIKAEELFTNDMADIIAEVPADKLAEVLKTTGSREIGEVTDKAAFEAAGMTLTMEEALASWKGKLEKVFHSTVNAEKTPVESGLYKADSIYVCKNKVAKPTVFIPVFPGSNCEYDSAQAFQRAGANVNIKIFRNRNAQDITESVAEFKKAINDAQIIMFPGGFSAGDEPDGSAKFFATAFQNEEIKGAVEDLLHNRDGLALGICNGFQAMIKLGLVPNGQITGQDENSPTLTYNTIGRHISKMAYIKVVSNNSPWLAGAQLGGVYTNPASHGEGRFVAPEDVLKKLFANGQIATQYCDLEGNVTMDDEWNINGSYMAVEGILSPDGRCLGKMAHSERRGDGVAVNIFGEQDLKIFESGVKYFK
ncbi:MULTISPECIES: phosphoribosylformylglycinamidine synthase [unclassified Butyrivibrio]|uniref:phosphoribosylformylglycinamidine synthase n=1 Tax=unclassified Butyrivibrio TaxID=2639466 RepID=UPI0003B5692D|nr:MULTISPECIES: phosphoribosylformylglycinamidine synthase [unclassified Butyrivibrio]MDC7294706.1 phosphoribosylformylglycinamidine synthase [Butyrivibrio sp. DSM 10294]